MRTRHRSTTVRSFLAVVLLALPVMAAAADMEGGQQDHVPFLSGGIGDEERKSFEAMGREYTLKLTLALRSGEFVGDTMVRIQDAQGRTVLDADANGPLFFVKLPPGAYTVRCNREGSVQKQAAHVTAGKQTQLQFTWSAD